MERLCLAPVARDDGYAYRNGFRRTYRTVSVRDWCQRHDAPYRVLIPAQQSLNFGPWYGPDPDFSTPSGFLKPEAYLAEVADCYVPGGFGVVIQGEEALLDLALVSDRYDLVSALLPLVNREQTIMDVPQIDEEPIPEGILLQSWFATNYHHWLVEHLPRLLLTDGIPLDVPLLVDGHVEQTPQLIEALRSLTDRPYIPLSSGVLYHVNHLYVPSCLFGTGPNLQRGLEVEVGDVNVAREAIDYLRDRWAPAGTGHRRIYIDRRAVMAPVRLRNGEDVQRVFADFGFETVRPAQMTFTEQRATFGDAAYIAGESGAAMTNVLLAPPSAVMVCMHAQRWPLSIYANLAAYGGQRSLFITGEDLSNEAGDGRTYQASFVINTDLLSGTLARILSV